MLVTNMWGNVDPEVGVAREQQLAREFVKPALDKGAQLLRHNDTTESAHEIIRSILKNRRAVLQVQQELVDEKREFDRTTVGEEINREVGESAKKLERQVEVLQSVLAKVMHREKETRLQLEAEVAELLEEIKRHTERSGSLNAGYKTMKAKAKTLWASLWSPAGGIGISSILICALYYCLSL